MATPSAVSSPSTPLGVRAPLLLRCLKGPSAERLPFALAALTVLSQIGYPLTSGAVRDRLTVITVLLWCAASLSHALVSRGWRFTAGLLLISAGIGFATEAVGTATGWPFGSYDYTSTLGPRLAGVPLIIPLAWTMMAYPALLVGRRIGSPVFGGVLAFASWDLFLDPQMVQAGHWHFAGSGPAVNGIPLTNTAGWILVSLVIMLLLCQLPDPVQQTGRNPLRTDRVPLGFYLWTYASSVLAAAVFFDRPGVALAGGLVMGIPVSLLVSRLRAAEALRIPAAST
jgi:carotene biosynthesis associated membrane protein